VEEEDYHARLRHLDQSVLRWVLAFELPFSTSRRKYLLSPPITAAEGCEAREKAGYLPNRGQT
jgi:hypothetical protein